MRPPARQDREPTSAEGLNGGHEAKRNLGKSFAESAVGAFLGFDLLTKAIEAIGFGARFVKKRQQSNPNSQFSNVSTRGPNPGPPSVAGLPSSPVGPSSVARVHRSNSRRNLLGVGVFSFCSVVALVFFVLRSETGDSVQQVGVSRGSQSPQPSFSESAPLGKNWDVVSRSVVLIEADGADCGWRGSGTIILDGSYVLTNQHVSGDGECDLTVWFTDSASAVPTKSVKARVVVSDDEIDLAVLRLLSESGEPFIDLSRQALAIRVTTPKLGEKVFILGYPGLGGSTITLTSGDFAGIDVSEQTQYFKTTASMNPGVSGGAALDDNGELIGIPTAGIGADIVCEGNDDCVANGSTIGLVRPSSYAQDIISQITR